MPRTPQDNMIDIPVVLSKKVDGVIYNLIVRSSTDQVFQDNYSLTEILKDVSKSIDARVTKEEYAEVQQHLNTFFADQPEELQTLRDVHNYIQSANNKIELPQIMRTTRKERPMAGVFVIQCSRKIHGTQMSTSTKIAT